MEITGKDFLIKRDKGSFSLYLLSKTDKLNIEGYFTHLQTALKRVRTWRKSKKYPHKHQTLELTREIQRIQKLDRKLNEYSMIVYKPIQKLDEEINGVRGVRSKPRS